VGLRLSIEIRWLPVWMGCDHSHLPHRSLRATKKFADSDVFTNVYSRFTGGLPILTACGPVGAALPRIATALQTPAEGPPFCAVIVLSGTARNTPPRRRHAAATLARKTSTSRLSSEES
jgi:hypothetical protein